MRICIDDQQLLDIMHTHNLPLTVKLNRVDILAMSETVWAAILHAVWPARETRHPYHLEIEDICRRI